MRRFRGFAWSALALLFLGLPSVWAESVKDLAQPTSYVDDLAGVIDADAKAQMEALGAEVERKAHATIEIVTIHNLGGQNIDEFATELEEKWKVGPKGTDRGVIMLFAIDDHKRRIEVGYGLEGVLNDAKVGDIGRTMVDQLRQGDYGAAILGGEQQIAQDIAADAGVTLDPRPVVPRQQQRARRGNGGGIGIVPLILLVLFLLFIFRGGRGGRGGGGGGGGWLPWLVLGNIMGAGRGRYGDGGGGGWGGGDGGRSGGGDDGGFSGGFGGSSGGGGASGDW